MSAREQPVEEFCPRCGVWVTQLDDYTGWCKSCAPTTRGDEVCRRCGERRPADHYIAGRSDSGVCRACRTKIRVAYRQRNLEADHAYANARRAALGHGRCAVCGYRQPVTAAGVLGAHQPSHRYVVGVERCAGSGQPPQEASTT